MPVWWVSEPYASAWISDVPVWYLTSRGEPFEFRLTYKQRDTRPDPNSQTNGGWVAVSGWDNSWTSFIHIQYADLGCVDNSCAFNTAAVTLFLGEGGAVEFAGSGTTRYDPATGLMLQEVRPGSVAMNRSGSDTGDNGLRLTHVDGSQDIYGRSSGSRTPTNQVSYGDYLLTRRIDRHGNTTWFNWEYVSQEPYWPRWRVKSVVDSDNRTNTLTYYANGLLQQVSSPDGLTAQFGYDANKNLTTLVDAAGLTSTLTYDANGWPTALVTPYGTNAFECTATVTNGDTIVARSVAVTEPTGGTHLYLYQSQTPVLATNYPAGDVPTNTPVGTLDDGNGTTNELASLGYRDSFYWNPRQYSGLSTTNLDRLSANDYARGRMRHWLQDSNELYVSELLSVERAPSPDGVLEGLKVFYDYPNKLFPWQAGSNALPGVAASRLPGGETHYQYVQYDEWGNPTNQVSTWTGANGALATRTNQWVWALNTYNYVWGGLDLVGAVTNTFTIRDLLTQVIGPDGNAVWTGAGYDPVVWTNDLKAATGQTNRTLLISNRLLPRWLTNAANEVTALTFTNFNRLSSLKYASGLTVTNLYDSNGWLWRSIGQEIQRTNSFAYTTNGAVRAWTNALGLAVNATWDGLNRLTGAGFPDGTSISNAYDRLYVGARKDRLNHWTGFGYDGLQNVTSLTDARTNVTTLGWCDCGVLESLTDALLTNTTSLSYNNQGLLTGILFADGSSVTRTLDGLGQLTRVADGQGKGLSFGYNNQGLVTVVSNATGRLKSIVYDVRDRPVQVTDANNITITNQFDALNRLTNRIWPDNVSEGFGWATNGLVAYTNRNGKVTRFTRDAAGRLAGVTNANLEITALGYNALNELTDLWDGRTNHTVWHYDKYGWLSNKVDALTHEVVRYSRDANGQVTNRWTPQFGNAAYTYDEVGNLRNSSNAFSMVSFGYDADNRLQTMVDGVGTTTFGYTPAGQLQSEAGPTATLTYGYTQGLRTSLSVGSLGFGYGYDSAWRLQTLTSPAGTFGYEYSQAPFTFHVSRITLPNGAWTTNRYDSLARLDYTALVNPWGHVLDGYGYGMDLLGLRTNIVRDLGLTTSTVSVGYDNTEQITSWSARESNGVLRQNEQLNYVYDGAGNLRYRTNGGLVQTFNCDAVNQLTNVSRNNVMTVSGATPTPALSVTVNGQPAQTNGDFTFAATNISLVNGQNTFTIVAQKPGSGTLTNIDICNLPSAIALAYDLNGNLTNDGTRSFAYDAENRLLSNWVAGAWSAAFVYDGLGRRRIERDYAWSSAMGNWQLTNELHVIYDGYLPIQVRDTNNTVLWTYTRGLDLSGSLAGGIGGLLARTDPSGSTFYHADGAGNITGLMDGQENMAARYMYSAFGKLTGKWGPMADMNEMQFSSMPLHRLSGLVHFHGREYDAIPQRWLQPDPLGVLFDTNPYRINYNSPLRYIDPDGLGPQLTSVSFNATTGAQTGAGYADYNLANGPYRGGAGNPLPVLASLSPDTQSEAQRLGNSLGLGGNAEAVDAIKQMMDLLMIGFPEMGEAGEIGQLGKLGQAGKVCPKAAKTTASVAQPVVKGFGNIGGGATTAENALGQAQKWLGQGYKEIAPGVYRSADNTLQFRMTVSDLTDLKQGPHVHFEAIGPDGRTIIENSHIGISNP